MVKKYDIIYKYGRQPKETIDTFYEKQEAYNMLKEYQMAFRGQGQVWIKTKIIYNKKKEV